VIVEIEFEVMCGACVWKRGGWCLHTDHGLVKSLVSPETCPLLEGEKPEVLDAKESNS
jgi:hypothetical protein